MLAAIRVAQIAVEQRPEGVAVGRAEHAERPIGTQIGFAIGGFAPTAAAAVATTRETFDVPLHELGRRLPRPRPRPAVPAARERSGAGVS